jgi:hypothetical protein
MAEPVRVGELLAGFPGVAERLAEARLLAAWPEIAGPAAARSRAEGLEDGVLQVAVESSGWLHRLTLEEPGLVTRCRAIAPAVTVRAIRFRLAPLAPANEAASAAGAGAGRPPAPPDEEMKATIDAALAPVRGHPGIATALGRLMRAPGVRRGEGEGSR